jgi:V/A-type H+-transporting ATPase subunit E
MAEELQSLLERINEDGVKKAEEEKAKIISEAEKKAEQIIKEAEARAEELMKKASEEAEQNEKRAASAIRQAARDITLALKEELQNRLRAVVKESVGKAMTPELMGKIILEMEKSFIEKNGEESLGLEILINKKDLEAMENHIKAELLKNLKEKPEFSIGHDFSAGLKIAVKGDDLFFDFSDETLTEIICEYVGPRLAEIINGA